MKAMTILRRLRAADGEIRRLEISIRQKREILTAKSGPQMDPSGGSHGSGSRDRIPDGLAAVDLLERKKADREARKSVEQASACALLDMVPELESKILYGYYVLGEDTTATARRLSYQPNYTRKKKRDGEKLMDLLTPERVAGTLPRWYLELEGGEQYGTEAGKRR